MAITPERDDGPTASAADASEAGHEHLGSGLDRPIQELLGRQLRAAYGMMAEKPAYLGDPGVPVEFELQLQRLESRERAHDRGLEAVEQALQAVGHEPAAGADHDGATASSRPPHRHFTAV